MVDPLERVQMAAAVRAIARARKIVLTCHINPDGDALGSVIGLGLGLESLGKEITMLSADGVPLIYSFLAGTDRVISRTDRRDFDLAIVLDAGDLSRTGESEAVVRATPVVMDVDHHVTGGVFGDVRLLDSDASATAELVYDLLVALRIPLTRAIAEPLLCGLMTDTGLFRYLSVTPRTMQIGGELIRAGAVPNTIAEWVFENKPFAAQKLLGCALDSMRRTDDGKIVWAHLTPEDFAAFHTSDEGTDSIINSIRVVQGADVAFLMRPTSDNRYRVSLRSRVTFDVSLVAAEFGGGGHRLAAGCTVDGSLADTEARLLSAIQRHMSTMPGGAQ